MKVLIIHGYKDKGLFSWRKWLKKQLEQDGHEVIVPNMPNSDEPVYSEWLNHINENFGEVLSEEKIILVGHSLGGFLSLKLAEIYKFKKIVLVAPMGDIPKRISQKWLKERTFKHPAVFQFLKDGGQFDLEKMQKKNKNIVIINSLVDKVINEKMKKMVIDKTTWAKVLDLPDYGFWLLASGFWLLASGFWLLASGFWLLASKLLYSMIDSLKLKMLC